MAGKKKAASTSGLQPGTGRLESVTLTREMVADAFAADEGEKNQLGYRYLGRGYLSLSGKVTGSRAATFPKGVDSISREVSTAWNVSYIESTEQLKEALRIGAAASYESGGDSGSVAVDFFRSLTIDRKSIALLIEVNSEAAVAAQIDYEMGARLEEDLGKTTDNNLIYHTYGDRFVGEVQIGGRFYMFLRYTWESIAEKETLKAKAKAAVGSFSAKASYEHSMESLKTFKSEVSKTEVYGVGGPRPSVEEAYQYSLDFPTKVSRSRTWVPLSMLTYPLNDLDGWNINRQRMDLSKAVAALKSLDTLIFATEEFLSRWGEVISFPHHFVGESLDQARANVATLEKLKGNLEASALAVIETPMQEEIEIKFSIPKECKDLPVEIPRFSPTVVGHYQTVTRDTHDGDGVATWSQGPLIVGQSDNNKTNWLVAHAGSHRNVRHFGLEIVPDKKHGLAPPMLELRYRARYSTGDTGWATGGAKVRSLTHGGTLLMLGIEFELAGEMADAYWIEYRVHAMKEADGPVHGNTPGKEMGMATNKTYIEGVRLAIWPKD